MSKAIVSLFLLAVLATGAQGATTLDGAYRPVFAAPGVVKSMAPMADGRVVVAGDFTTMSGVPARRVARINADGTADATFQVAADIDITRINAVAVQGDGKVLIGGHMVRYGETASQNYLFRLNVDGSRDATFNAGGFVYAAGAPYGLDNEVSALAIDAAGRILVGGYFYSPHPFFTRLESNGAVDPTFAPGTGPDNVVTHIALQSTGKIVIGGAFGMVAGTLKMNVARLESTGALDSLAFGAGVSGGHLLALAVQPDDRVLIGGNFSAVNGLPTDNLMARFDATGVLETGFAPVGVANLQAITALTATSTQIFVGGWYSFIVFNGSPTDHAAQVYVLQASDGGWLTSASFMGKPTDTLAFARRPDGTVAFGGSFTRRDDPGDSSLAAGIGLMTVGEYPVMHATWRPQAGGQAEIRTIARQPDGKLVLGGNFHLVNGVAKNSVARLNVDGTLDATLDTPVIEGGIVNGLIVRDDGKLVVAGTFYDIAGQNYKDIALLSPTGAYEAGAYVGSVNALAAYPGGKILAAMPWAPGIRRLDATLAIEGTGTFNPGGITNEQQSDFDFDRVNAVAVQPDGRIVVGGSFMAWGGAARQNVVRLNADGTTDASFTSPAFTTSAFRTEVFAIALQGDGKILIAGRWSTVGGLAKPTVARLNADGTVDATFVTPFLDQGSTAYALAVEPSGAILVGGSMQLIEGAAIYNNLVRLAAGGARDTTMAASLAGEVRSLKVVPWAGGYQLFAGGKIEAADGASMAGLVRYLEGIDPASDPDADGIPNGVELALGTNPYAKDNDIFSPGLGAGYLFAMQQYRDFLNREGDWAGVEGWANAVASGAWTRPQVIDAFLQSQEFGGFVAPVVRLYFATYLRVPDYAGLVFNAGLVRAGTITVAQLADFFATSPEFAAAYGSLTNAQFVTLLYANVLGRPADPGGLAGWTALLDGGMSRGQVLLGFSESGEYQGAMAHEVLVTMMYAGMLRRTPDPAGFSGWVTFLDNATYTREQVINGFFLSGEYRARFLP